jgi:hypothetical protein
MGLNHRLNGFLMTARAAADAAVLEGEPASLPVFCRIATDPSHEGLPAPRATPPGMGPKTLLC